MADYIVWGIGLFILVDILVIIYVFYKRKKRGLSDGDRQKYQKYWRSIKGNSDYKHAVMDADKLLGTLLEAHGYQGSLGEMLRKSEKMFSDYNGIWSAHKLRNRLAHEIDIKVSNGEYVSALKKFERAFRDLTLL